MSDHDTPEIGSASREAVLADLGVCPFKEYVNDASMCRCGLPALDHDTYAEQIVMSDHPAIAALLAERDAALREVAERDARLAKVEALADRWERNDPELTFDTVSARRWSARRLRAALANPDGGGQ